MTTYTIHAYYCIKPRLRFTTGALDSWPGGADAVRCGNHILAYIAKVEADTPEAAAECLFIDSNSGFITVFGQISEHPDARRSMSTGDILRIRVGNKVVAVLGCEGVGWRDMR